MVQLILTRSALLWPRGSQFVNALTVVSDGRQSVQLEREFPHLRMWSVSSKLSGENELCAARVSGTSLARLCRHHGGFP
jgi:hypothetical protein